MLPTLSEEAWALLGFLHRTAHGGAMAPRGFEGEYTALEESGLVQHGRITSKGETALIERYARPPAPRP
jgi:hypothetical protein